MQTKLLAIVIKISLKDVIKTDKGVMTFYIETQ